MEVRIEPLDTLFFRDGKPFSQGEETWADGYLLPPPSVIYGALRTAIATQNGIAFEEVEEKLGKNIFSVKNIYYSLGDNNVLPLPLDLVEYGDKKPEIQIAEKEKKEYEVRPLHLTPFGDLVLSAKKNKPRYFPLPQQGVKVENMEHGCILATELSKYLSGKLELNEVDIEYTKALKLTDYIQNEPKVGIGREDLTRTAEEGNLYRVDMKRGDGLKIGVTFDLEEYQHLSPVVQLGGERKLALLEPRLRPFSIALPQIDFIKGRFKIYFATAAILTEGEPDLSGLGISATLVAACVGKPVSIGGYDILNNKAKPMYRAVPAGSVFYYETESDVSLLNDKQGCSLSCKLKEQGFGVAYFGIWNIHD